MHEAVGLYLFTRGLRRCRFMRLCKSTARSKSCMAGQTDSCNIIKVEA